MRKNFLLLFLLALLPMAGWAADPSARTGLIAGSNYPVANAGNSTGYRYAYAITSGTTKPAWSAASASVPTTNGRAAGTYRVYWANRQSNNGVRESEWDDQNHYFEITIGELSLSAAGAQYDGENHDFPDVRYNGTTIANGITYDDVNWTVAWTRSGSSVNYYQDVATYTCTVTTQGGSTVHGRGTLSFQVTEGTNWFDPDALAIEGWTYEPDTYASAPKNAPSGATPRWGVIEYQYRSTSSWGTYAAVVGGNAGNYQVRAHVAADGNNYGEINSTAASFTIAKADLTVTEPTAVSKTYTGSEQTLAAAYSKTGTGADCYTLYFSINNGSTWVTSYSATDVETKSVVWYAKSNDPNYADFGSTTSPKGPITVAITQAENAFTAAPTIANITFGTAPAPTGGTANFGTSTIKYEYQKENTSTWSEAAAIGFTNDENDIAGNWKVKAVVAATPNYKAAESDAVPFTINPKAFADFITATPAMASGWTYKAAEDKVLTKGVTASKSYNPTYTLKNADDEVVATATDWGNLKVEDAGTYKAYYAATPASKYHNNYSATGDQEIGSITIERATLHMGAQGLNVVYGATPAPTYLDLIKFDEGEIPAGDKPKANELKNTLVTFTSIEGGTKDNLPTDVGEYDFVLAPNDEGSNYKLVDFIPGGTLTITKADATAATVAAATLTYNGAEQELLDVDDTALDGGTMKYYLAASDTEAAPARDSGKWLDGIPKGTEADNYYVWYYVKGDNNHKDSYDETDPLKPAVQVPVTIAQKLLAAGMFTFDPASTAEYTGGNLKPTVTAFDAVAGAPEENALDAENDFTVTAADEMVNVNTYNFTFTAKADGNYSGTITVPFEITAKALDAEGVVFALQTASVEYDGDDHKADVQVNPTAPLTAADFDVVLPTEMINVADYTVTLNAKGNYSGSANLTFSITKAENAVTITQDGWTYKGTAKAPVVTAKFAATGEPTITYYKRNGDAVGDKLDGVPTEAGDYWVKASVEEATNWEGAEQQAKFTIAPFAVTPTIPKALPLTYNGLDQALVKAGEAEGATIQYKLIDEEGENEFGDAIPEAKNADTYMVAYKFTVDPNYVFTTATEGTVSVKINRAHVKYSLGNQEETYKGTAFDPVENEAYRLVDGDLMLGDAITFTFVEGFDNVNANTGLPFTELAYTGADNYTVEFTTNSGVLTINKAEFAANQYTAPEAIEGLTYDPDKESQVLVQGASVVKVNDVPLGTIKYAFSESATVAPETGWTTEVPAKKDAGTYNVWFYVEGDANHLDTPPALIEGVAIAPTALLAEWLPAKYLDEDKNIKPVEVPYKAENYVFNDITLEGLAASTDHENGDYDVIAPEMYDADDYEIKVKGLNNYAGSNLIIPVTINPADLIVIAPNAKKTYDGTTKIEKNEFEDPIYVGLQKPDVINFGEGKTFADFVTVPENAINVGTYKTTLNVPAELNPNYVIGEGGSQTGTLAINKAAAVKIGFKDGVSYSKVYGTEADGLVVVPADLEAKAGEFFDDFATINDQLTITRTQDGEVVTEEGYTIKLGLADELPENPFTANYEAVTFGEGKFFITPYQGDIKVSIASASQTYNGAEPTLAWEENLSNMVVVGLPNENKAEIFSVLPTITIVGVDEYGHAGDYNIELSGGESKNYNIEKIKFLEGSYFTVDPVIVSAQFNSIPVVAEGADATEVLKNVEYEVVAAESDAEVLKKNINKFTLDFKPGFVTTDGKIAAGVNGKDALVLTYNPDEENGEVANFMFEDGELVATADINIGGEGSTIALDDSGEIVTYASEGSTVTFTESRAVTADSWQALVLPFDVTPAQLSDAFGYAAVDVFDKARTNAKEIHFSLMVTGTIEAGTPFLFKTDNDRNFAKTEDKPGVKFEGVNLANTDDLEAKRIVEDDDTESPTDIKFIGTFEKVELTTSGYRYMSGGKWWSTKDGQAKPYVIKPLRAYLDLGNDFNGARIFIEEPDGTTSIMDVNSFNDMLNAEGWYTIEGKKLNAAPTQKGIYIQNGKKVVIK